MGHLQHTPTRQPARRPPQRGAARPSSDESTAPFRYGGPYFAAASGLPLNPGLGRPSRLLTLLAEAMRQPRRVVALVVLLMRTPTEAVPLSQAPAGRGLRRYFNQRFLGVFPQNRLCRAVLLLPPSHADYLRGRHRQALRTNLSRAAAAGIQCDWIRDPSRAATAGREILRCRRVEPLTEAAIERIVRSWSELLAGSDVTFAVARDGRGAPLAIILAEIDERVCLIHSAVASNHEARWALHDHLVQFLIARGVKYLLCEGGGPFGAVGFAPEVHHYQRLLGYELRHLVPRGAHPCAAAIPTRRLDVLGWYPARSRGH